MSPQTEPARNYTLRELETKTLKELYEIAKEVNVPQYREARKRELMFRILKSQAESKDLYFLEGILEIIPPNPQSQNDGASVSSDDQLLSVFRRHLHRRFPNSSLQPPQRGPRDGESPETERE